MRFLLDTCIISEAAKKNPNPKVLNWLMQHEANSAIPSLAIAERSQGIAWLPAHEQGTKAKDLERWTLENAERILPFDADAAIEWGKYVAATRETPKGLIDTQIAAIALSRDMIVVTRNVNDFPQVQTFNPFE